MSRCGHFLQMTHRQRIDSAVTSGGGQKRLARDELKYFTTTIYRVPTYLDIRCLHTGLLTAHVWYLAKL
jgi:hypothetical protein